MRLLVHIGKVLGATLRFGHLGGRAAVIAVVVIGLFVVAATLSAKVVVPLAVYPFA